MLTGTNGSLHEISHCDETLPKSMVLTLDRAVLNISQNILEISCVFVVTWVTKTKIRFWFCRWLCTCVNISVVTFVTSNTRELEVSKNFPSPIFTMVIYL